MVSNFPLGENPSRRRQTAKMILEAVEAMSAEKVLSFRTPDCIHEILPRSLKQPPLNNEQFGAFFKTIETQFRSFHVTVHELVEDTAANNITMWVSSTSATNIGPFANEYMLMLFFNDDGRSITRFLEFVDSAFTQDFFTRLEGHAAFSQGEKGA